MDITGISILIIAIAIVLFVALTVFYNMKQAASLHEMRGAVDDFIVMYAKERRAKQLKEVKVEDFIQWLTTQSGLTVTNVSRTTHSPEAIECNTSEGMNLVVAALPKEKLRRELKRFEIRNKNLAHLNTPLLGRNPGKVEVEEKNVINSGDHFDLEADQVGKAAGVEWGETPRLFFYYVPLR